MADGRVIESDLLDEIRSRIERVSEARHQLARNHRILIEAATQLRLGRSAEVVLAKIQEQSPALLSDYCDLQLTLAAAPLRLAGRLAASA